MNAIQQSLLGLGCPDCGGGCNNQLGTVDTPSTDWSCQDWITWHKSLVTQFKATGATDAKAQEYAKTLFLKWWDDLNSFFGSMNWCGYNTEFFTYFKSVGITEHISYVATLVTPVTKAASNVAESAGNVLTSTGKTAENTVDTASNITGLLTWLVPVAIGGITLGLGVYAYKHYIKGDEKIKVPKPSLGEVKPAKTKTTQRKKVIYI